MRIPTQASYDRANSPGSALVPILDMMSDIRLYWRIAEQRLKEAEQHVENLTEQNKVLEDELARHRSTQMFLSSQVSVLKNRQITQNDFVSNVVRFLDPINSVLPSRVQTLNQAHATVNPTKSPSRVQAVDLFESNQTSVLGASTVSRQNDKPNRVQITTSKKRSVSASRLLDDHFILPRINRCFDDSAKSSNRSKLSDLVEPWTDGRSISECLHKFVVCHTFFGGCVVCNRRMKINEKAFQCECCKIYVHVGCQDQVPLPCLPDSFFPKVMFELNWQIALRDYCPTIPPYVPAILIRCVTALETDRLETKGIYRVAGMKDDVDYLYKSFGYSIPNIALEKTETITSCIKLFLRKLSSPLVPHAYFNELIATAEDTVNFVRAILKLPRQNRDTLAFLCLHLQKVAEASDVNGMEVEDLAAYLYSPFFGIVKKSGVVGYVQNLTCFDDPRSQRHLLEKLIKIPAKFWSDCLTEGARV